MRYIFITTLLATTMLASPVLAQTVTATQSTTVQANTNLKAYNSLSPGNQMIARALFSTQVSSSTSASTKPLTLNQIATMKESGKGWAEIFEGMKAQGRLQDKTLGQVVSRYNRLQRVNASEITKIEESNQTSIKDKSRGDLDDRDVEGSLRSTLPNNPEPRSSSSGSVQGNVGNSFSVGHGAGSRGPGGGLGGGGRVGVGLGRR